MSKKTIHQLMPELIAACGAVGKEGFNKHNKYNYRSVDDIMAAVNPALVKTGVSLAPTYTLLANEPIEKGSRVLLSLDLKFIAPDGSYISTGAIGEGKDFGDKATYKAMAGALKYALLQTLCIPTDEAKDPEADTTVDKPKKKAPSKKKAAPKKTPKEKAPKGGWVNRINVCNDADELEAMRDDALEYTLNVGPESEEGKAIIRRFNERREELKRA